MGLDLRERAGFVPSLTQSGPRCRHGRWVSAVDRKPPDGLEPSDMPSCRRRGRGGPARVSASGTGRPSGASSYPDDNDVRVRQAGFQTAAMLSVVRSAIRAWVTPVRPAGVGDSRKW